MAAKIFMVIMFALAIEGSFVTEPKSKLALCDGKLPQYFGGYEYFNNIGYYKLYTIETTWGKAWYQCRNDGGHLLVINSDEEFGAILDLMRDTDPRTSAFIGAHDLFLQYHYITVTGEDLIASRYNIWDDGEPNSGEEEDQQCVKIHNIGRLFLSKCSSAGYFICEMSFRCNKSDTSDSILGPI